MIRQRIVMFFLMRKIDSRLMLFDDYPLDKSEIVDLTDTPYKKKCLYALRDAGAIELDIGDNQIIGIARGKQGHLYLLNRSELWANRIASYIAGIISGLLVAYLIRLIAG